MASDGSPCPTLLSDCNGVELSQLGQHLSIEFPVRRLDGASIIWINRRWLLESGFDIAEPDVIAGIERDIIDNFAVIATAPPAPGRRGDPPMTLHADRYGGTGGSLHGGSGRCGFRGRLNAKGIGRTPLVSDCVDIYHSHGFLPLHEALREAISSEIAAAEFPWGAVPVIAILDAGYSLQLSKELRSERCAILVRPNVLRPAHFERSILFGSGGAEGTEQYIDSLRVKEVFSAVLGCDPSPIGDFPGISIMFERIAQQIGAGRALRLWQGQFLTSNISVTGEIVDFGSFRATPSWRRAIGAPGEEFGSELKSISSAIRSISFYNKKYCGGMGPPLDEVGLLDRVKIMTDGAFRAECAEGMGLHNCYDRQFDELLSLIMEYYRIQQTDMVKIDGHKNLRGEWLFDLIKELSAGRDLQRFSLCGRSIAITLQNVAMSLPEVCSMKSILRWLLPRPNIYYAISHRRALRFAEALGEHSSIRAPRVDRYIDAQISMARRKWRWAPKRTDVLGYAVRAGTECLWTQHRINKTKSIVIKVPVIGNNIYVFGKKLSVDHIVFPVAHYDMGSAIISIPSDDVEGTVLLNGVLFDLPRRWLANIGL